MKKHRSAGFSIVEVMVASVLLAVLAIGGGAVLYHTGSDIQVYGNKRIALELGRTQMERLVAMDYLTLRARASEATAGDVVLENGVQFTRETELILHGIEPDDPDVGWLGNEWLELDVTVQYGRGAGEKVELNTMKVLLP